MRKNLFIGGILGPLLFTATTILCASVVPNYNHAHQFISELGAEGAETQNLMNWLGFIPTGLLIMLFSWAMLIRNKSVLGKIGATMIGIFSLGLILSGIFSCDIGCPNFGSSLNNIHQTIAPIAFVSICLGILFTGLSFRKKPQMCRFGFYTIYSSVLAMILLVLLVQSLESRTYIGLVQRLLLGTVFIWMAICGYILFRKNKILSEDESN